MKVDKTDKTKPGEQPTDENLKPKPGEEGAPLNEGGDAPTDDENPKPTESNEDEVVQQAEPTTPAKEDPLLSALLRDLGEEVPEIKPVDDKPAEPKPGEKPVDDPNKKTEAAPAKPKKKGVVVELPKDIIPPPPSAAPAAPAVPSKTEPEKKVDTTDADADYIAGLTDEQKEELAEAEKAEEMFPAKYKGRKSKLIAFYRKFDQDVQGIITSNPDKKLEEIPEFQTLVNTKPKLEVADFKKVQRQLGADHATAKVREEFAPKLTEIERKQQEMEYQPKVEAVKKSFRTGVSGLFDTDTESSMHTIHKLHLEKGPEEVAKQFPMEHKIATEEFRRHEDMAGEYMKFLPRKDRTGKDLPPIVQFDPSNQTHNDLVQFIGDQTEAMLVAGQKDPSVLMNNGKRFVSREDYLRVKETQPQEIHKYWTFGHQDIFEMLAIDTKSSIERRIKDEDERLRGLGYERKKPSAAAATENPKPEPKPINPPKATPKPGKGTGIQPKPAAAVAAGDPISVVDTLRLRE